LRCLYGTALRRAGAQVQPDEIDLLYRVLDVNQTGFLEADELRRFQSRLRGGRGDAHMNDASLSLTRI